MEILETIRLIGWRSWLFYTLHLDDICDWFLRVYYCHHNARVVEDFEERMTGIIYHATGGMMSKPYYDEASMRVQIDDYIQRCCEEAVEEDRKYGARSAASELDSEGA